MSETVYQVMTDGDVFRIRSIRRERCLFITQKVYRWESYGPYDKTYEDAVARIKRMFGEMAHIEYRPWRPA